MVFGEVDAQRPQPQNVGAIVAHQVDRADRVAERLRHFEALGIHGEAMREDGLIRRLSARAAAFEQRRLEPAAMLVAAFEIEVGAVRAAVVADERGPAPAFEHRSEEHTSELQSLVRISYAVFCLKKKITEDHTYIGKEHK